MNASKCIAITALGVAVAACNAVPPSLYGDKPQVAGATPDMAVPLPPDMAESPFPEGPYGNQAGDTFFDLDLSGYRLSLAENDPAKVAFEDHITLASVRSRSNAKCIWLAVDAFW